MGSLSRAHVMIAMVIAAVGLDGLRHQTKTGQGTGTKTQDHDGRWHTHPALRRRGKKKRSR